MKLRIRLLVALLAAGLPRVRAAEQPPATPFAEETVRLEQMTVQGDSVPAWLGATQDRLQWSVPPSLAGTAETIPGLALHHMGAAAAEPILRGLGSDRVVATLDGLPLPNASPTRTASPIALIAAGIPTGFRIVSAVPSVTLGPPANAGYLQLSSALPDKTSRTYFGASWNTGRDGGDILAAETIAQGPWTSRAAVAAHRLGDYTSGDGTVVPAADRNFGAAFQGEWQPDPQHQLRLGALFSRQSLAVNSALPLDTRNTDTAAFTVGYGLGISATTRIETRLGVGVIRPHLDNAGRPNPARINADGRTGSLAGGLTIRHQTGGGDEIALGIDATSEERRLDRKRPGAVDLLWPDLRQDDVGAFAELTRTLNSAWKLRLGGRLDAARSDARTADGLAFGRSIRSLYVLYNGNAAADTTRSEVAGAANVLFTGKLGTDLLTTIGAGYSRQPPGATERYRAFSDALGGGYEIGNPAANAEDKYELDWNLVWHRRQFTVTAGVFGSLLPNYLHRTRVGVTPAPAPPPPGSIVYGYRATSADFWGGELETMWQPAPDSWLHLTLAGVEGMDRDAHRRLPEVAPATLNLGLGHAWSTKALNPWVEVGLRAAAAQGNPAPADMPVFADTAAYALGTLRAGLTWRGMRISVSVENLFDRQYYDYLSPPAGPTPAGGTLVPGARVPGLGRTVLLTISHALP